MNVLQQHAIQVQYCTYMSLGSAVMPDLAVGHFRDFPSAPGCPLRLFGWQAWCLLPSRVPRPVPPFPCRRAASSRAKSLVMPTRVPFPKMHLLFQVRLFQHWQHIVPPIPQGLPSLGFYYFPCVIGFTANAAQCARTWICRQGNKVCICVVSPCWCAFFIFSISMLLSRSYLPPVQSC
jgi:hypothetical protein